jgi:acetyltransferase
MGCKGSRVRIPPFVDTHTSGTLADLAQRKSDLAIIALPPAEVPAALEVAGRIGCRAAWCCPAAWMQTRPPIQENSARTRACICWAPIHSGSSARTCSSMPARPARWRSDGPLALVCQSGAFTSSILDWASNNAVGFSSVVSLGPNTDVDIAQVLDFLAHDARTQSIVVYMEGISNARRFMSALRSAANAKPVVVLKAGRKPAGNEAAQTHSGTIVGSDDVFDAALRRAGAVRVRSFVELFSAAKCLASRYRPVGKRLAIVTNGGGPGVLAADWVNEILLEPGQAVARERWRTQAQLPPWRRCQILIDLSEDAGP